MIRAKIQWPIGSKTLVLGLLMAALLTAASLMLAAPKPAHADTTFTVTRTDDFEDPDPGDGECGFFAGRGGQVCTLRAAIEEANTFPGADTINFNIPDDPNVPGNEVKTISPASDLPEIKEQVTIGGYTQTGASPNTLAGSTNAVLKVQLRGNDTILRGLAVTASNVVVRGLVINDFRAHGIDIVSGTGTRIEGSFIGTDPSGTQERGNRVLGVSINGGETHTIGGTTPDKRNLISGNGNNGVSIDNPANGNKVQGNLIGTNKDGTSDLGNENSGVGIRESSNNTAGGADPGAANTIAFNDFVGVGVDVFDYGSTNNRILGNSIFSNGALGIDLGINGRTLNDPKDRDAGPNTLQNFPVLTSVESAGEDKVAIKGKLNSTPNKKFTVQFFSSPSGEDEGKTFLGKKKVTTTRQGQASFTFEASQVSGSENITASATGPGGNTSEFSDPLVRLT